MTFTKEDYLNSCIQVLKQKIKSINDIMSETQGAANSDTKSSAGDKHETSRAMAHLENERLGKQLEVLNSQLEKVFSINPELISTNISFGSVIICTDFSFFISTGLGKVKLNDNLMFFAIATDSPIGKELIQKNIGDSISVGNKSQKIIDIL